MLGALAIAMAFGIALADASEGVPRAAWGPAVAGLLGLAHRRGRPAGALLLAFAAGWLSLATQRAEADRATRAAPREATVEAVVAARSGAWNPRWLDLEDTRGAGAARLRLHADPSDALDPWLPGDRVRARLRVAPRHAARNPGDTRGGEAARRAGVGLVGTLRHPSLIVSDESHGLSALRALHAWRRRVAAGLARGGAGSDLLRGLALGDRDAIPAERREAFVRLGLAHALAVSGLHLAWVVAATFALARALVGRSAWITARVDARRVALCGASAVGLLYAALAGWGVPVQRAWWLLLAAGLAIVRRRPAASGSALGGAALLLLAREPDALFQPGAQLSFAAVAALIGASRRTDTPDDVAAARGALARHGEEMLRRSATAILATAPLLAWHGGGVSAVALAANALVLPWLGVVVLPVALGSALGVGLEAPGVETLVPLAAALADRTGRALELAASTLPPLDRARPGPAAGAVILALSAAGLAARAARHRVLAVLGLALVLGLAPAAPIGPEVPRLVVLDVGQGDAILVQDAEASVLMDAGGAWADGDQGQRRVVPALRALGVSRLDLVLASHADLDHRGGLPAVLAALPVGEVWLPWGAGEDAGFEAVRRAARLRGTRLREVGEGSPTRRVGALRVAPLWPPRGTAGSRNARSLVVRIDTDGGHRMLLPGDVDADAERQLISRAAALRAEILLLPHHGSRSSSSEAFLDAIDPRLAIASAPCRGRFGMPHPTVRGRLARRATPLGWTGRDGALRVPLRGPLRVLGTGRPARCP